MIKKFTKNKFASMALGFFAAAGAFAQTNCYMQISSSSNTTLCPGAPIVLTATTAAVNVGTGAAGNLTVTGLTFANVTRSAITGANTTGLNNKVRVTTPGGFSIGDEVMLITMQDPNQGASNLVGKYEFATIASIGFDTLRFTGVLTNTYNASGSIKHQVMKVPHYNNVLVSNGGLLTCYSWNGSTGGVICFRASGQVSVSPTGSISASGRGYRGVLQKSALWQDANGGQGEGIYGTGIGSGGNGASNCLNNGTFNNANGNGGGGGTGCGDAGGGGGGGHASAGGSGINWGHSPGLGGNSVGNASMTALYMGGAGGEGGADEDGAYPGAGGDGGGIVFIATSSLAVSGYIQCNGENGNNGSNGSPGSGCGTTAGGGGAGGSIVLQANVVSGSGVNIDVTGGVGGNSVGNCNDGSRTGGNGALGRIRIERTTGSLTTSPAAYQISIPALTGLGYLWNTTASTQTTGVSPMVTTVYNVTITSGSSCIGTSTSFTVPVRIPPTLNISGNSTICAGQGVQMIGSGATTYTWLNTNTNSATLLIAPAVSTIYTLTGTDAQGCTATPLTRAISVYSVPVIGISGTTAICAGGSAVLTGVGANTYTWSTGSNNSLITVSPTASSVYTLSGRSSDGCAGNTVIKGVGVYTVPVLSITGANTLCAGGSVVLTGAGASTFTWVNGGTNNSTLNISPITNETYSLTGTSLQGCNGLMVSQAVTVYSLPVISIAGSSVLCAGQSQMLTANGASTYTWMNNNSNTTSYSITPTANTSYTLAGASSQGCDGTPAILAVSVSSVPVIAISGTNAVCQGGSVVLTASGANTYTWSNSTNASTVSVSPTSNTTYTVNGTNAEGCVGTPVTRVVTVNTLPVLSISGANTLCAGGSVVLTGAGATTFTWVNGGSNNSALNISPITNQTYSLTGTSLQGCNGVMVSQAVTVYSLPVISIAGSTVLCGGQSQVLTANGASTYTWMNNNSNTTSYSITPTASTSYTLAGTSPQGCNGTPAILAVSVSTVPVIAVSGTSAVCQGGSVVLTASGANTYTWSNSTNGSTLSVSPVSTTTYTVNGTNAGGCVGTPMSMAVTVNTVPVLSISGSNTLCAGGSVSLTANGASTYTWSGVTSNSTQVTVSPVTTSTYTLAGLSSAGCAGIPATFAVTAYSLPVIAITGTTAICTGGNTTLTAAGATSYTWINTGANSTTLSVSPTANTTYSLVGINPNGCQGNTAVLSVNVFSLPIVTIAGTNTVCNGGTLTLTANGATTYTWLNTNSNNTSLSANPTVATTYSLRGVSAQGCAGNTATLAVTVYSTPVLSIAGSTAICNGASATFTGSGANSFLWINNASTTASIASSPSVNTTYSLTGSSSFGCPGNTVTVLLTVNPNPTITVTGNASVCAGASASLSATGANSYSWTSGATSSAVVLSPTVSTTYTISGTFTTGCNSTRTVAVTIYTLPVLSIMGTTVICAGDTTQLTASGATSFQWNTGANTSSVAVSPSNTASYTLVGTTSNGCVSNIVRSITVNPRPILAISGNTAVCENANVTKAISGANSYTWSTGATTNSIVLTPTIVSGFYTYSVTGVSLAGCISKRADSVRVNALPTLTITGGSFVCSGNALTLDAFGANTYSWSTGSITSSLVVSPTANTSYSVIGTNTTGCFSMAVNDVTVIAFPSVSITGNTAVCIGDSISLTANGANSYLWSTGATSSVVVVSPTVSSTFSLVGSVGVGCSDTTQTTINVNALPVLSFNLDRTEICLGESAVIAVLGANSYSWNTGANTASISVSPTIVTTYSAIGTSSDNCSSTSTVEVKVSECTGISSLTTKNSVEVFPNPFNDKISITTGSQSNIIQVLSAIGQVLYTEKSSSTTTIDLARFDNGMYLVRITADNGTVITKTVVKQ